MQLNKTNDDSLSKTRNPNLTNQNTTIIICDVLILKDRNKNKTLIKYQTNEINILETKPRN